MQQLFENWRKYLKEEMKTLATLPENVFIEIIQDPSGNLPYSGGEIAYTITLFDGKERFGSCTVEEIEREQLGDGFFSDGDVVFDDRFALEDGLEAEGRVQELYDCEDEWFDVFEKLYTLHIEVDDYLVNRGYGPLLIDLAMELATRDGRWIIAPNIAHFGTTVTDDARKVMEYYFNKRTDVKKIAINLKCWQFFSGINIEEEFGNLPNALLHLYKKTPTILYSEEAKRKIKFS